MKRATISRTARGLLLVVLLLGNALASGCRTEIGTGGHGQLPSDDVTYFAPGPEFKLSKEAAHKQALEAETGLEQAKP